MRFAILLIFVSLLTACSVFDQPNSEDAQIMPLGEALATATEITRQNSSESNTAFATNTTVPATNTPLPATDTKVPATSTRVPPTNTPRPRVIRTVYARSDVNVRSCAGTNCEVLDVLSLNDEIDILGETTGQAVSGSTTWYQFNLNGQTAYVHASVTSASRIVIQQAAPPPPPSNNTSSTTNTQPTQPPPPPQNTNNVRPGNCSTAVAMGLSAVEAAKWSHLDRDKDGVACYGD